MMWITGPASLLARGLPYREKPKGQVWQGVSGARTFADKRYGLPWPKDRLMLIDLATEARMQGRVVRRKLRDIRERFDLTWPDTRIVESVLRVTLSEYEPPLSSSCCGEECDTFRVRERVANRVTRCRSTGELVIVLSEHFMSDAREGFPCNAEHVARLVRDDHVAALDLLLFVWWKEYLGERDPILVHDGGGLFGLLCAPEYEYKVYRAVRKRWAQLQAIDAHLPYQLTDNAQYLVSRKAAGKPVEPWHSRAWLPARRAKPARHATASPLQPSGPLADRVQELRRKQGQLTDLPWQSRAIRSSEDSPAVTEDDNCIDEVGDVHT